MPPHAFDTMSKTVTVGTPAFFQFTLNQDSPNAYPGKSLLP